MAAQIGAGKDFNFQNMHLFKTQPLGIGSYGSVYRAKCDQLPCAAKLLHPVLVNPLERRNLQRFEQECQFLSGIRHPHIVQYLGTCRDPESNHPVLLMELMDDSLTHFLEASPERLPYHLEVNLCHDIALALAYLHSNGIIHRDLSSNNVLLIAGSRAKVTDFGMSKLLDAAPQMTPLTQCPGTAAYMPPEAFKVPPVYTSKLDSFAHGVLGIQIMTRQFPEPGSALQDIEDPRSPVGVIKIPIPDTERRKSHIDRIDPNHPLLPIAIRCLSYNERDRPSTQQLCHQLAVLKETPQYVQSVQRARERGRPEQSSTADMEAKDGRIAELQRSVAVCEWEIRELQEQIQGKEQQLREKDATVVTSQQEIQRLGKELDQTTREKQRLRQQLDQTTRDKQRLRQQLDQTTRDKQRLRQQLDQTTRDKQRLRQELDQTTRDKQRLGQELDQTTRDKQRLRQELDQTTRDKQRLGQEVREKNDQIEGRERQRRDIEHIIAEFQQTLIQKEKRIRDLEETISARGREVQEGPKVKQQRKRSEASNTAVDTIKLNWRQCPKAPCGMFRGSATVDGSMAYFRPWDKRTVQAYDADKEVWSQMPEYPHNMFTLATVNGLLTAVGGYQSGKPTNTLLSLTGEGSKRKWSKHFPPMPTKRYWTAVVCSGRSLVVAGGTGDIITILSTVEVMDTESLQWFTASSLPHPLSSASATICGENLYLLGSYDQSGQTKSVFTCSLSVLLQSCQPQPLGARSLSPAQESGVWQKTADTPVYQSTCTTLCGHLLAVGGRDSDRKPITAIHKYDPINDSWTVISHMAIPRYRGLVAVLPGDKLMVVGGNVDTYRKIPDVEIATVL